MVLLIVFFLLSIIFSFACSVWEAVLLSITPSYITRKEEENPSLGEDLKEFKEDIDKPLSAILTLNTIAHTVGAIGVGAQAGKVFGDNSISLGGFNLSYEAIIATVMTLAILLLSEIIPKTLGANNWRSLAPFTVKCIKFIMFILTPFIWLSMRITKMFKSSDVHSVLSRADYLAMTKLGEESGALETTETNIIKNLLDLEQVQIEDVMTPKSVVFMTDETSTLSEYYKNKEGFQHSRIPLYEGSSDHISGFILKDDILEGIIAGNGDQPLKSLKRPIKFVSDRMNLNEFFNEMNAENAHIAIATDKFGTMNGIVTLEDVVETILGYEIVDETDKYADLQAYAKKKWQDRVNRLKSKS